MKTDTIHSVSIEDVAERLGMRVVRHRTLCPFHDDHHPSLSFSPSRGTWRCWACGERGDAAALVMRRLGTGFRQAVRWIENEQREGSFGKCHPRTATGTAPTPDTADNAIAPDSEMMEYIVGRSRLSTEACRFLFAERSYSPPAVIGLRIGSISSASMFATALETKFGKERTLRSGLVRQQSDGSLTSHFATPCLLLPYTDRNGTVTALQSRYLGRSNGVPRFQFMRGCRPGVFNLATLNTMKPGDDLWIAEGPTDCMALLSMHRKAIAIPSATLIDATTMPALAEFRLHMSPDNDEAGQSLFEHLEKVATQLGTTLTLHPLPKSCKDISDYYSR